MTFGVSRSGSVAKRKTPANDEVQREEPAGQGARAHERDEAEARGDLERELDELRRKARDAVGVRERERAVVRHAAAAAAEHAAHAAERDRERQLQGEASFGGGAL